MFLDSAASSQEARSPSSMRWITSIPHHLCEMCIAASLSGSSERSTELYDQARAQIAQFIGAPSERNVIFTRGTTESINLVAHGWGRKFLKAGDEVVLTEMEHHSNLVPWQVVAQATGAKLRFVPVREDGTLDLDAYRKLLSRRAKIVAFTHVSNVLGTVNPVKQMVADAHAAGAVALVDSAQGVPHMATSVLDLDCDFLAFSGHKMCGPTGIGVLYGRESLLNDMDPTCPAAR